MIRHIKDHFVPHVGNDHQPHFLRMRTAATLLGLIVAVEALYLVGTFAILPSSNYFAAVFASVLVDQTNVERQAEALGALKTNPLLERAAQLKAEDMVARGYFAHNSPDGKTPWYWFDQVGYNYAAAGENLAVNFVESKDVTDAWMLSPAHRANIMSGNYTEIGIAVVSGMHKGREAIFVVQVFGRPSLVAQKMVVEVPVAPIAAPTTLPPPPPAVAPAAAPIVKPVAKPAAKPIVQADVTPEPPAAPAPSPVSTPTTTVIAGVETQKLPVSALETVSPATTPSSDELIKVALAMTSAYESPTAVDEIVASPRRTTTMIYFILATFIAFALSLTVFIKVRHQPRHLIINGVLLIAITLSLVLLNSVIGFTHGMI